MGVLTTRTLRKSWYYMPHQVTQQYLPPTFLFESDSVLESSQPPIFQIIVSGRPPICACPSVM
jgi:hypothetical protein